MTAITTCESSRGGVAALLREYCGFLAFVCALLAAISIFAVSGVSLDAIGYHYDDEGGSALQKVHPGTLLLVAGLAFKILARPTLPGVANIFLDDKGLFVAIVGISLSVAYIAIVLGTPATPPIDAYLMPIFACFLLKDMSPRGLRLIACALIAFFVCNDLMAFYEAATGAHVLFVIPAGVTGHPEATGSKVFDWKGHLAWDTRSTAMLGHPLDNALITGAFVVVLQMKSAGWLPAWLRAALIGLCLPAMVTFGGRVALVTALAVSGGLWTFRFLCLVRNRRRLPTGGMAIAFMIVPLVLAGLAALASLGFFDRFWDRFVADNGSAEARLLMWRLFEPISWSDLVFGPDQDVVKMWQRLQGLELGIESFWAGMPLGYGFAVMAVVLTSWVAMFTFLDKAAGRDAWLPILDFMIVGSTSAGLASKSVTLGNLVVMILVFFGPSRRPKRRPPRVAAPTLGQQLEAARARRPPLDGWT